jgi:hypothetical protein
MLNAHMHMRNDQTHSKWDAGSMAMMLWLDWRGLLM